jgi:hypothetical protein
MEPKNFTHDPCAKNGSWKNRPHTLALVGIIRTIPISIHGRPKAQVLYGFEFRLREQVLGVLVPIRNTLRNDLVLFSNEILHIAVGVKLSDEVVTPSISDE